MTNRYVLDEDGHPRKEPHLMKWARWFEAHPKPVALTEIGGIRISTVFLSLDHRYGDGPPILWETMVFVGKGHRAPLDDYTERYTSLADAKRGHDAIVGKITRMQLPSVPYPRFKP